MQEADLRRLLDLIRFDDRAHVAMLSDALIDAGREGEAELLRSMHGLPRKNYYLMARRQAAEITSEFVDELRAVVCGGWWDGKFWRLPNNVEDRFVEAVDQLEWDFKLTEAIEVTHQLNDYLETDDGLWHHQDPEDAICTQAFFTMRNAVRGKIEDLLEEVHDACEDLVEQMNESEDAGNESDVERLRGEIREEIVKTIKEWR